jgi:hypothetical protein
VLLERPPQALKTDPKGKKLTANNALSSKRNAVCANGYFSKNRNRAAKDPNPRRILVGGYLYLWACLDEIRAAFFELLEVGCEVKSQLVVFCHVFLCARP